MEEMEELCIEGLADHDDRKPCVEVPQGRGEALTGARAGRAIEPRNQRVRGADTVYESGRQHCQWRYRELLVDPARSETLLHVRNLHGREPGGPALARLGDHRAGRSGKAKAVRLRCTGAGSQTTS